MCQQVFREKKKLQVFLGEKQEGEEVGTVPSFRRKPTGCASKLSAESLQVFRGQKQEEEEEGTVTFSRIKSSESCLQPTQLSKSAAT